MLSIPQPTGIMRATPALRKFQHIAKAGLAQSRKRRSIWHQLYLYVRCIKIASIPPQRRTMRQCRELSDWIWMQLPGNNILSRVHWEDRAKVAKYMLLMRTPENTIVSLQSQSPDAFKILLGGVCSEWQERKRGQHPVLQQMNENEKQKKQISLNPRRSAINTNTLTISISKANTPRNCKNTIQSRMMGIKSNPNQDRKRGGADRKHRRFACKSPQTLFQEEKHKPTTLSTSIEDTFGIPASQLRKVSCLPGEHQAIIAQVLAEVAKEEQEQQQNGNESEQCSTKSTPKFSRSPSRNGSNGPFPSRNGSNPNVSRNVSRCGSLLKPRQLARPRRHSLCTNLGSPKPKTPKKDEKKSVTSKLAHCGETAWPKEKIISPARRRRQSLVGEMVHVQRKILNKFIETGKDRKSVFGYDTNNINQKELQLQYQKEEENVKETAAVKEQNLSLFMVKTMGRRIGTLVPGNSFDSLVLFSEEHRSTSSIITDCDCEFLYLSQEDLNRVLQLGNRRRLRTKVLSLEAIPIFQILHYSARLRVSNISKIRTFLDGDILPSHDTQNNRKRALCYWILSGKCEIVTKSKNKILVRRNHGSIVHECGLMQCHPDYYENVIDVSNGKGDAIKTLSHKVKVRCVGQVEFIRFYWDEFLRTLDKMPRIKILKYTRNVINQLMNYMDFINVQNKCNSQLLRRGPQSMKAAVPAPSVHAVQQKKTKGMRRSFTVTALVPRKVFDFEPEIIRNLDAPKVNRLTKSVSTTHLLFPQFQQTHQENKTLKKLSSSISFSNLMSPQTMMQYAENYQIQNGQQWKGKENEMLLARQPTPRTLSRVISGKQGMRSVFVSSAERVIKPGQVQAYMNQICSNKKNQTRKFEMSAKHNSKIMLRDNSTGNLNVFF